MSATLQIEDVARKRRSEVAGKDVPAEVQPDNSGII